MKKILPILSISLFFAFAAFSLLVHFNLFTTIDFDISVKLQDNLSRAFDTPFSLLSLLGSVEIVSILLLTLLALSRKLKSIIVLFFFGLFHIVELFGKSFVDHPGPSFRFFRYDIDFSFPSSYVQPGSSYPSGHSGRAIFISIILGFLISKTKIKKQQKNILYLLIFIFDVVMCVSRVYLGEHWTSDVIGGGLLGASFAFFSLLFLL